MRWVCMVKCWTAYQRSTLRLYLLATTGVAAHTSRWLLAALDLGEFPVPSDKSTEEKYTLLLAEAAVGGDEANLERITQALCGHGVLAEDLARYGGD